jgi:hypothetical protein
MAPSTQVVDSKLGEPLIIRASERDYCFATWDRVLISMWLGEMALEAAQAQLTAARRFVADNQGVPLSCLSIVGSHCPPPREKARVQLATTCRELEAAGVEQIWVAEGSESRAALVLGIGLAVSTAASPTLRLKFAVTVYEAAEMIAPRLSGASGRVPVLTSIVDQVRSHMGS